MFLSAIHTRHNDQLCLLEVNYEETPVVPALAKHALLVHELTKKSLHLVVRELGVLENSIVPRPQLAVELLQLRTRL